jgi:uncharacterized membrane protein YeaQ/YmgE (transglycosylase-associated protein family)
MARQFLCWILTLVLLAGTAFGQADKIHRQVDKIGVLGNITVSVAGAEYYGSINRIDANDFSINEVDQRREITLRYSDVKRVRAGYGTTRSISGRRIHPRTRLIVAVAVIGGLLLLAIVAVAADKS